MNRFGVNQPRFHQPSANQLSTGKSSTKHVVGVDIGGANLKYATAFSDPEIRPVAHACCFPMWRRPEDLAQALIGDLHSLGPCDAMAVTMTGELADGFVDRAVGVTHIVEHTMRAAGEIGIDDVRFYRVDGSFCDAHKAINEPDAVAAANWHALASWIAGRIESDALLVDIGSTTTDLIPIADGSVNTDAATDFHRLREGTLVYVGCRRTAVCSLVDSLVHRGDRVSVMNEVFATIDDARIVLKANVESQDDVDTADGMPRTIAMSVNRLARMIGLDHRSVSIDDAVNLAQQVVLAARTRVQASFERLWDGRSVVVLSGHAADLIDLPDGIRTVSLCEQFGPDVSRSAPAYAVAELCLSELS